ncbi:hypothetical protein ACN6K8_003425 [[Kitasatospora] papulosa]|uniref:WD40 repeat domain-containing protein n=1 Tax=Streptomyces TaxID=1883 RepID=UPI000BCE2087|nr:WD40 repeat protein [Streptomyces avidinii]SNX81239.1 WD40 repeat [Streptomyces microflavus]
MTSTGTAPRGYARLLNHEPPPEDADEIREDLLGPAQPLFALVKHWVADRDVVALRRLAGEVTPLHRLLADDPVTRRLPPDLAARGAPFRVGEGPLVCAARGLASLGLALADPDATADALDAALRHIHAAGLAAPVSPWSTATGVAADEDLSRCLGVLASLPGAGGAPAGDQPSDARLTALVTLQHLAGLAPRRGRPQRVSVLLSRGAVGRRATLVACRQPGAPAGLVPDPRRMSLFSADARFLASAARAWSHAGAGRADCAVVWWLENEEGPVQHVADASLGAAFATVLDEVRRKTPWTSVVWPPTRLSDDIAVVGDVDTLGNLREVGGYREKLAAAGQETTRVLVPVSDEEEAQRVSPSRLTIESAATWRKAARRARSRDTRTVVRDTLLVLLLTAVAAGSYALFGLQQERDRSEHRQLTARSRQLVEEAGGLERGAPGLARQLLLMAYDMSPTAQARGALLRSLTLAGSFHHGVLTRSRASKVAFAPSGDVLAVGAVEGVALQDVSRGRPLAVLSKAGTAHTSALAFSPDGRVLAVGSGLGDEGDSLPGGQVQLWDVADPLHPVRLTTLDYANSVTALAFSPRGDLLAIGGDHAPLRLWNVSRPDRPVAERTLAGTTGSGDVSFAPGGRQLASLTDRTLTLWDLEGRRLASITPGPDPFFQLAYAPGGTRLATTSLRKREITVWDVSDPRRPRVSAVIGDCDTLVGFARDDEHLVATSDGKVALRRLVHDDDGRLVDDTSFRVELDRSTPDGGVAAYSMAIAPDGRTVAAAQSDGTVRLWDVSVFPEPGALAVVGNGSGGRPAFSPDAALMAVECDITVCLWDVRDPHALRRIGVLPDHASSDRPYAPWFSADGTTLFTTTWQDRVDAWNVTRPSSPALIGSFDAGDSHSYRFSPDGTLLIAAQPVAGGRSINEKLALVLWDLRTPGRPERVATLPGVPTRTIVPELAISPDNKTVAALGFTDDGLSLWDISDRRKPLRLPTRKTEDNGALWLSFSPDSRWVLQSGDVVRLWRVGDTLHIGGLPFLAGSLARGTRLTFSPAGSLLVSEVIKGNSARVWSVDDISTPTDLTVLLPSTSFNSDWAFSPDARTVTATNREGSISLWALDVADVKKRLCTRLGARISPEQWKRYLPELPYAPPCDQS